MPDRSRKPKLPRDTNQRAFQVVALLTGTAAPETPKPEKDPAAVSLGRRGGLKGGKARAAKLSPEQRKATAKKAAAARWHPSSA